jgi:hypothetical protein
MKKQGPSWVHAEPSNWLYEISIPKTLCDHFWPGQMAGAEIEHGRKTKNNSY